MSRHMLSDSNTMNDFNPYVMGDFSLPGASRKPHAFEMHTAPAQEKVFPEDRTSPLCDYGITAGDNTIDMCRPVAPNCSLSRPLVPGRNIDRGFTVPEKSRKVRKVPEMLVLLLLIVLILLIAVR